MRGDDLFFDIHAGHDHTCNDHSYDWWGHHQYEGCILVDTHSIVIDDFVDA